MRLYVSNLPWVTTEEEFQQLFERYGKVTACEIVTDRESGRSRGFGFVTMGSESEAHDALKALNDFELQPPQERSRPRRIRVEVAKSRPAIGRRV